MLELCVRYYRASDGAVIGELAQDVNSGCAGLVHYLSHPQDHKTMYQNIMSSVVASASALAGKSTCRSFHPSVAFITTAV